MVKGYWGCFKGKPLFVSFKFTIQNQLYQPVKSAAEADQISILESGNFYAKRLGRQGGTCCYGMSVFLLHKWLRPAPNDFLTIKFPHQKFATVFWIDYRYHVFRKRFISLTSVLHSSQKDRILILDAHFLLDLSTMEAAPTPECHCWTK